MFTLLARAETIALPGAATSMAGCVKSRVKPKSFRSLAEQVRRGPGEEKLERSPRRVCPKFRVVPSRSCQVKRLFEEATVITSSRAWRPNEVRVVRRLSIPEGTHECGGPGMQLNILGPVQDKDLPFLPGQCG